MGSWCWINPILTNIVNPIQYPIHIAQQWRGGRRKGKEEGKKERMEGRKEGRKRERKKEK